MLLDHKLVVNVVKVELKVHIELPIHFRNKDWEMRCSRGRESSVWRGARERRRPSESNAYVWPAAGGERPGLPWVPMGASGLTRSFSPQIAVGADYFTFFFSIASCVLYGWLAVRPIYWTLLQYSSNMWIGRYDWIYIFHFFFYKKWALSWTCFKRLFAVIITK